MAKKNSTKTATKEAQQSSEPKLMTYKGWKGINISEAPLGWNPIDEGEFNESNLLANYLAVQNNAKTTTSGSIETRPDLETICIPPDGLHFNGVCCLRNDYLICAFNDNSIRWIKINDDDNWHIIKIIDVEDGTIEPKMHWSSINYYEESLVCLTGPIDENTLKASGEIFTGGFNGKEPPVSISNTKKIPDPKISPTLNVVGSLKEGEVSRISVGYVYSNKFGTTTSNAMNWSTITVEDGPERWHSGKYLQISGSIQSEYGSEYNSYAIEGVDLYCRVDENSDSIFIGHVDLFSGQDTWIFNWLGAMADTSAWTSVSLQLPTENTTKGVDASYMRVHDGRLYFWGGSDRSRLWIGGNPGNELSIARGVGGAFVDIEPGNGMEVKGTAKFKTYNGASIVTIMCSNPNTSKVKRYNLLETNLTISNELSAKGYMTEEVANVIGSMSHHGFGSWADGLYTIGRYGVMLTTMAMESNNQLRATSVSDPISPIFNDIKANRLIKSNMIFIDDTIYIVMGTESPQASDLYDELDRLILCYDVNAKVWWTYTYDNDDVILTLINIDSIDHWEGLGIVTHDKICLIPTTGSVSEIVPDAEILIETGELTVRQPPQQMTYLSQIEIRFDYFIGDCIIVVEGIDYYGRRRVIKKDVSVSDMQRRYPVWLRIDELFETYKLRIQGKARFRMTHFIAKLYTQSYKIDQVYGFTDHSYYANRHGGDTNIHHALESYNNLRDAIIT